MKKAKTHCLNIFDEKIKNIEFEIIISDEGEENKNLDFKFYCNNTQMWHMPDTRNKNVNEVCAKVHAGVAGGWSRVRYAGPLST